MVVAGVVAGTGEAGVVAGTDEAGVVAGTTTGTEAVSTVVTGVTDGVTVEEMTVL